MGFVELFMIAIGLSMDAFAVAICKGLNMKKVNYKHTFIIALFFGLFQGIMPLIGWLLGKSFEQYITSIDHWIAFILLGLIGVNMIREGVNCNDESAEEACTVLECNMEKLNIKKLTIMAVATSIDALAIGITFAFLNVSIVPAVSLIGITTFTISLGGVFIGNYFGVKYKNKAEIAGGAILILIGIKILLSHLGVF